MNLLNGPFEIHIPGAPRLKDASSSSSIKHYSDYFVVMVHAAHVCVSITHRTLTWTTGSLMYMCDLFACVTTQDVEFIVSSQGPLWGIESAQCFDSREIANSVQSLA